MPRPFKIYRIICTLTDKSLVSGSDLPHNHRGAPGRPGQWHQRGSWSYSAGAFWKTENAVRRHLRNLCYDWERRWAPPRDPSRPYNRDTWTEPCSPPDWSRLQFLRVEQIYITTYATTTLLASDFMGLAAPDDAPVEASPRQVEQPIRETP